MAAVMTRPVPAGIPTKGIRSYLYQRSPTHRHQGIDMVAPEGTEVRAVADGTITHAAEKLEPGFSGYGGHVVLHMADGKHWALYAHLQRALVKPGDKVKRGQVIGTVGRTCYDRTHPGKLCKGAHLHFEVAQRPYPMASEAPRVDPVAYLSEWEEATPAQQPQVSRQSQVSSAVMTLALGWLARRVFG